MDAPPTIDPIEVKRQSEAAVLSAGGRICDWLPVIETTRARELGEVIDRALILNALLQLYFGAPSRVISDWIDRESLRGALSARESTLLAWSRSSVWVGCSCLQVIGEQPTST